MRLVGVIVLVALAAFAAASGIATLPYAQNDPCSIYARETEPYPNVPTQLVPYGLRCEYVDGQGRPQVEVLAPSTGAFVAWLAVIAAVLGVAVRYRRRAAARGVVSATLVLGSCGLAAQYSELMGGMLFASFFTPPLCLAVELALRRSMGAWLQSTVQAAALPTTVIVAWTFGGLNGWYPAGVAFGLVAGALVAVACDRWIPPYRHVTRVTQGPFKRIEGPAD